MEEFEKKILDDAKKIIAEMEYPIPEDVGSLVILKVLFDIQNELERIKEWIHLDK